MLCSILESGPSGDLCSICKTVPQVLQTYCQSFNPKDLVEVPQVGDGIAGPASEAPGHCCPWHPPRRLSRARVAQPRRCPRSPPRGAAFGLRRFPWRTTAEEADAPRRRPKLGAAELCTRSTHKQTIFLFDSTSYSICSKQNIITNNHKHTEQVSLHVVYNIDFNRTFCNSFSKTDNASKEQCRQVCQLFDNTHGVKSGSRSQGSKGVPCQKKLW